MISEYLKIFGLKNGASINDVKKTYRKLAKQHHPDRFMNNEEKIKQEEKMVRINLAYNTLVSHFYDLKKENVPASIKNNSKQHELEQDYIIYKKGIDFFNKYCGCFSRNNHYFNFDLETLDAKTNDLKTAQSCFMQVLMEYPDSDWAFDSEERLKKIDILMSSLEKRKNVTKNNRF